MGKKYSQLTPWEQKYIMDRAGIVPLKTIAMVLGCNPQRIKNWASKHGISVRYIYKRK
nr:MAG: hypothetical protein [Bacteriophage sp.]